MDHSIEVHDSSCETASSVPSDGSPETKSAGRQRAPQHCSLVESDKIDEMPAQRQLTKAGASRKRRLVNADCSEISRTRQHINSETKKRDDFNRSDKGGQMNLVRSWDPASDHAKRSDESSIIDHHANSATSRLESNSTRLLSMQDTRIHRESIGSVRDPSSLRKLVKPKNPNPVNKLASSLASSDSMQPQEGSRSTGIFSSKTLPQLPQQSGLQSLNFPRPGLLDLQIMQQLRDGTTNTNSPWLQLLVNTNHRSAARSDVTSSSVPAPSMQNLSPLLAPAQSRLSVASIVSEQLLRASPGQIAQALGSTGAFPPPHVQETLSQRIQEQQLLPIGLRTLNPTLLLGSHRLAPSGVAKDTARNPQQSQGSSTPSVAYSSSDATQFRGDIGRSCVHNIANDLQADGRAKAAASVVSKTDERSHLQEQILFSQKQYRSWEKSNDARDSTSVLSRDDTAGGGRGLKSPTQGGRSVPLYLEKDEAVLSSYQCLVRQQIELFEATEDDVQFTISKMSKPVALGQVGIRCRHCAVLPQYARPKAAIYFPRSLDSMYQFGQNMVKNHLTLACKMIPASTRDRLVELQEERRRGRGGRERWAEAARELGIDEGDGGNFLRFKR